MKAFFGKIWAWIVAHKVVSIVIAAALVVGTTSAIVLPIALHKHSFATEWSSDADNHWHDATCKHGEEKDGVAAHTYDAMGRMLSSYSFENIRFLHIEGVRSW